MKGLTEKQRRMLDFIEDFMSASSMAPTVYEIADNFKIKTSTVFAHLRALQRKSYLTRSSKARSISLTKPRRRVKRNSNVSPLPVPILGGAGSSLSEMSKPESDGAKRCELFCDPSLVDNGIDKKALFALRIQGHGLKDIGILDGDLVVVKPSNNNFKSGDIVVSAINGKTIVQSYKQGNEQPMTRSTTTIPAITTDIKGIVVALQRKF